MSPLEMVDYQKIAQSLVANYHRPGLPGDNKPLAFTLLFDGSMSVVAANGMKFTFSKQVVDQVHEELKLIQKPASKPPGRPKTTSKPKKTG